jgi:hypothetical protein
MHLEPARRAERVDEYLRKGIAFLEQARAADPKKWPAVVRDVLPAAEYQPLRGREEYRRLVKP